MHAFLNKKGLLVPTILCVVLDIFTTNCEYPGTPGGPAHILLSLSGLNPLIQSEEEQNIKVQN